MNIYKYLPIGSVVKMKDKKVMLMIIGYCKSIKVDKKKTKDYVACLYPQGLLNLRESLAIKHEDIEEVVHEGYKDSNYNILNLIFNKIDKGVKSDE